MAQQADPFAQFAVPVTSAPQAQPASVPPPTGAPPAGDPFSEFVVPISNDPKTQASIAGMASAGGQEFLANAAPWNLLGLLYESEEEAERTLPPGLPFGGLAIAAEQFLTGAAKAHWEEGKKAYELLKTVNPLDPGANSQFLQAVGHGLAAVTPLIGPGVARYAEDISSGDPQRMARGVGGAIGMATPLAYSRLGGKRVPGIFGPPKDPALRAATEWGAGKNITFGAGPATANRFVRGVQGFVDRSFLGSMVAEGKGAATAQQLEAAGQELAQRVSPRPENKLSAGTAIGKEAARVEAKAHGEANTAYQEVRDITGRPEFTKEVPKYSGAELAAQQTARAERMTHSLGYVPDEAALNELQAMRNELENMRYSKGKLVPDELLPPEQPGVTGQTHYAKGSANADVLHDIQQRSGSYISGQELVKAIDRAIETGVFTGPTKAAIEVAKKRLEGSQTVSSPLFEKPGTPQQKPPPEMVEMQFPVDLKMYKDFLTDQYRQMKQQMGVTQRGLSPGLDALEDLVTGPDFKPFDILDRDLSAIKTISRGNQAMRAAGVRTPSQAQAAQVVKVLEEAMQSAAAGAGPQFGPQLTAARDAGRAAIRQRSLLETVRKNLGMKDLDTFSPVALVKRLLQPDNVMLPKLLLVKRHYPTMIPKIGRALMTELLKASREGKPGTALTRWKSIGDETKQVLFPSAAHVAEIDNFLTLQNSIAQNVNPSGSAFTALQAGEVVGLATSPKKGGIASLDLGMGALLMHSKFGVKLLADGFRIPATNKAAVAVWLSQVQREIDKAKPADDEDTSADIDLASRTL